MHAKGAGCGVGVKGVPDRPDIGAPIRTVPTRGQRRSIDGDGRGPLHPLRWRPFTWFIVGYNTFLIGVVGVVMIAEAGDPSPEGGELFVVLAFFLGFLGGNLWLAIAWGISGAVTSRRRPEGQPVRRRIWLFAPSGLAAGAIVGLLLIHAG